MCASNFITWTQNQFLLNNGFSRRANRWIREDGVYQHPAFSGNGLYEVCKQCFIIFIGSQHNEWKHCDIHNVTPDFFPFHHHLLPLPQRHDKPDQPPHLTSWHATLCCWICLWLFLLHDCFIPLLVHPSWSQLGSYYSSSFSALYYHACHSCEYQLLCYYENLDSLVGLILVSLGC